MICEENREILKKYYFPFGRQVERRVADIGLGWAYWGCTDAIQPLAPDKNQTIVYLGVGMLNLKKRVILRYFTGLMFTGVPGSLQNTILRYNKLF